MTAQERSTQLRVGIFMAIGLSAIALMVVYFGRFGDSVRGFYRIRVDYPNASGIYKGASVLLAGAKIGFVENNPVILPDMDGVAVNLKIY
jgi:phospholipid/cholesterol/gamma-HCH transport system substrate-binding protein